VNGSQVTGVSVTEKHLYLLTGKAVDMRRVVLFGLALGFGTMLASAFPDIKRYIKISMM
jgi:hypothetical protein